MTEGAVTADAVLRRQQEVATKKCLANNCKTFLNADISLIISLRIVALYEPYEDHISYALWLLDHV